MSGLLLLETDCGVGKFGLELVHGGMSWKLGAVEVRSVSGEGLVGFIEFLVSLVVYCIIILCGALKA